LDKRALLVKTSKTQNIRFNTSALRVHAPSTRVHTPNTKVHALDTGDPCLDRSVTLGNQWMPCIIDEIMKRAIYIPMFEEE